MIQTAIFDMDGLLIDSEPLWFEAAVEVFNPIGINHILELLKYEGIKIGLATSSPSRLIDVVVDKLNIRSYFSAFSSAEFLEFGKPHPQVYLDCAVLLNSRPVDCICFEDSFFGMIAAKAARMHCVVVPHSDVREQLRFRAADHVLHSLNDFTKEMLA